MFCAYLITAYYMYADLKAAYELQILNSVAFFYIWLVMIYNLPFLMPCFMLKRRFEILNDMLRYF
jgi:hypothetical protein